MTILEILENLDEKQFERLHGEYPIIIHTNIENGWKLWNSQDMVINIERDKSRFMLTVDNGDGAIFDITNKNDVDELFTFIFLT